MPSKRTKVFQQDLSSQGTSGILYTVQQLFQLRRHFMVYLCYYAEYFTALIGQQMK